MVASEWWSWEIVTLAASMLGGASIVSLFSFAKDASFPFSRFLPLSSHGPGHSIHSPHLVLHHLPNPLLPLHRDCCSIREPSRSWSRMGSEVDCLGRAWALRHDLGVQQVSWAFFLLSLGSRDSKLTRFHPFSTILLIVRQRWALLFNEDEEVRVSRVFLPSLSSSRRFSKRIRSLTRLAISSSAARGCQNPAIRRVLPGSFRTPFRI